MPRLPRTPPAAPGERGGTLRIGTWHLETMPSRSPWAHRGCWSLDCLARRSGLGVCPGSGLTATRTLRPEPRAEAQLHQGSQHRGVPQGPSPGTCPRMRGAPPQPVPGGWAQGSQDSPPDWAPELTAGRCGRACQGQPGSRATTQATRGQSRRASLGTGPQLRATATHLDSELFLGQPVSPGLVPAPLDGCSSKKQPEGSPHWPHWPWGLRSWRPRLSSSSACPREPEDRFWAEGCQGQSHPARPRVPSRLTALPTRWGWRAQTALSHNLTHSLCVMLRA